MYNTQRKFWEFSQKKNGKCRNKRARNFISFINEIVAKKYTHTVLVSFIVSVISSFASIFRPSEYHEILSSVRTDNKGLWDSSWLEKKLGYQKKWTKAKFDFFFISLYFCFTLFVVRTNIKYQKCQQLICGCYNSLKFYNV